MKTTPKDNKICFDIEEREQIVFHRHYDPKVYEDGYGISKFEDLPLDVIKQLIEKGHMNLEDYMNCSPTVSEFV